MFAAYVLNQEEQVHSHEQRYQALATQVDELNSQIEPITEGQTTGNTGRIIGGCLAVIILAIVYDVRRGKPTSATAVVILLSVTYGLIMAGYQISCLIGKQRGHTSPDTQVQLTHLRHLAAKAQLLLRSQEGVVQQTRDDLAVIPQYESETSASYRN